MRLKIALMGFTVVLSIMGTTVITANAKMSDDKISETAFDVTTEHSKPTVKQTEEVTTKPTESVVSTSQAVKPSSSEYDESPSSDAPTSEIDDTSGFEEEPTEEETVVAKVTQVVSGNNVDNWSYQPLASEVSSLFVNIYQHGFDYVDSRYFDSNRSTNVVNNGIATTGYDLGVIDTKTGTSWLSTKATSGTAMSSDLIAMAIYKFYGVYEYDYTVDYQSIGEDDVIGGKDALVLDIGEPYNQLDLSEGLAKVYISNSEPSVYLSRYNREFGGTPAAGSFRGCLKTIYKMTKQFNGLLLSEDAIDDIWENDIVNVISTDTVEDKRVYTYFMYMGYIKETEWNAGYMSFGRFLEILNNIKNGTYNDIKTSKVTIVKSVNRYINGSYYVPNFEDIPDLTSLIQQRGPFAVVYTGQFNTRGADSVDTSKIAETSRALEILGYDMLLKSETFVQPPALNGETVSGDNVVILNQKIESMGRYPYEAVVLNESDKITKGTAIMDIYKALGLSQYDITMWTKKTSVDVLNNSPAILELPAYIDTVDPSKGYTYVWVTRTNVDKYTTKAENDLKIPATTSGVELTSGDFIVLLAEMMDYYGEPVISQSEVNQLLQVFGNDIPMYLTATEADAWVYLKVRGCLNDDSIKFYEPLTLNQMLEILACVADTDSRTTYKDIQLTLDIGDLVEEGFFPKQVTIFTGENALGVETSVEYNSAGNYDYFVEVTRQTQFKTGDGSEVKFLSVKEDGLSTSPMQGAEYIGKEYINGKYYYHFTVPSDIDLSNYVENANLHGCIKVSPTTEVGSSNALWLPVGGGIYTFSPTQGSKRLVEGMMLTRTSFTKTKVDSFKLYQDAERVVETKKVSVFERVLDWFSVKTAFARAPGASMSLKFIQTSAIDEEMTASELVNVLPEGFAFQVSSKGSFTLDKVNSVDYKKIGASITQDISKGETFQAISTIYGAEGSVMLQYADLIEHGILHQIDSSKLPEVDSGGVLTLYSDTGVIRLNSETNEIVVGNTIYRVPAETRLFRYEKDTNNSTVLWIDFRAVFGWSQDMCDMEILPTSTGDNWSLNISYKSDEEKAVQSDITTTYIALPDSFNPSTTSYLHTAKYYRAEDTGVIEMLCTTGYSLANWVIYEDGTSTARDYCIVFYPSAAMQGMSGNIGNSGLDLTEITGVSLDMDSWCYKVFELTREATSEVGKFSYTAKQGYVYNTPEWDDFQMSKYLSGEYILPISFNSQTKRFINANVNAFGGYAYGERPYAEGESIDIRGAIRKTSVVDDEFTDTIVAAPAGVVAFMAGGNPLYYKATSPVFTNTYTGKQTGDIQTYFGTMPIALPALDSGVAAVTLNFSYKGVSNAYTLELGSNSTFYNTNTRRLKVSSGTTVIQQIYVGYTGQINVSHESTVSAVEQLGDGVEERWDGFKDLSIQYMLQYIDNSTSFVILFALKVLPLVAICLLTLLVGLAIMADNKLVKLFCERVFDPIYWLTFGSLHIEEMNLVKHLFGLVIGDFAFIMICNGNLLRVIQFALDSFQALSKYLR